MPHRGIELIQRLLDRGIVVHVLNMDLMDNTPTGKLIRNIMLAFAEFERDMIVERTQEGKAIAKQKRLRYGAYARRFLKRIEKAA